MYEGIGVFGVQKKVENYGIRKLGTEETGRKEHTRLDWVREEKGGEKPPWI
jgi:hypothetical protein